MSDFIESNPEASAAFGQRGSRTETGTTAVTGSFYAIQILEEATFSLLTDATAHASSDAMTGFAIAPTTIYGDFTAFTLTSGKVRAYLK